MLAILVVAAAFSLGSLLHTVQLSNATIAPDGSRVAFLVSRADADANRYDDTIEIFDLAGKTMRPVSAGYRSIGSFAWSPNSRLLAAVMHDPKLDADQLFIIDPATGAQRELTHGSEDVWRIGWDPTGTQIAFTRQDQLPKKTGAAAFEDGFLVEDNAYLVTAPARPYQMWSVDLRGHERRLMHRELSIMDAPLSWSPDGRFIVYEAAPAVHALHPLATAWRLELATGRSSALTSHARSEDQALYSPDGSHVAYLYVRGGDPVNQPDAWVQGAGGSGDRDASLALDRAVSTLAWMPDGSSLLLQVDDRTREPLVLQGLNGAIKRLPMGDVGAVAIQPQGSVARDGTVVFVGDESRRPDELYVLHPGALAPTRLTKFNDAIAQLALGKVSRVTWRSDDGFEEDGVLTYPPGYIAGRRYPLVLRIHGGPYESSTVAFSTFYQLAASHGYLVFAPNYRGSMDLGNAYVHAIYNDPSTGPGRDVMAGIAAVERLGIVDQTRIAVSGWSYGGQLTSWLEGHYHIWRAAVAGAAVNDLVVDYAIADDIDASRLMFSQSTPYRGGALARWREESPITYYADIRTPTLILCNVYDVRVPIVESYEMFRALRDNSVPVGFYAYPSNGHLPNGPTREADVYRRWLGWFDRYLK